MVRTVLVTAGSGFIAGHCIEQLLKAGYNVVTTVRNVRKGQTLVDAFNPIIESSGAKLTFKIVEDVGREGAFDHVLKATPSLSAVLHTASPYHLNIQDPIKEFLEPAITGTTTLLEAVKSYGLSVKRVVLLSSFAAMRGGSKCNPPFYDESVWADVTWEMAVKDKQMTYRGSKTLSERAAWQFMSTASTPPLHFDLVALNPALVFGPAPLSSHWSSPSQVNTSNMRIVDMLQGKMRDRLEPTGMISWVDVRDVAKAHVAALEAEEVGRKRVLLLAGQYSNAMIARIIKGMDEGAKYRERLPEVLEDDWPPEGERYGFDNRRSRELLGIEYTSLENCVRDTVESLEKLGVV